MGIGLLEIILAVLADHRPGLHPLAELLRAD